METTTATDPSIQNRKSRTSAAFSLKSPQSPAHISSRAPAHHFSRFTLLRCSPVMQATNVSATPTSKWQLKVKWRKVEVQRSKLIVWLLHPNSSKCIWQSQQKTSNTNFSKHEVREARSRYQPLLVLRIHNRKSTLTTCENPCHPDFLTPRLLDLVRCPHPMRKCCREHPRPIVAVGDPNV